ncbi:MAG: RnfH family protein [Dokdonella sp.]
MIESGDQRSIQIEVAYAEPERQFLRCLQLPPGTTVAQAIEASGLAREYAIHTATLLAGVWSKAVAREAPLHDGDRVELYRPLKADPKDARRRRAEHTSAKRVRGNQP